MMFSGLSEAGAQEHDGWPTDPLVAKAIELLGSENFLEQAGVELPSMMLLDPTEEASCFVGPQDRVRAFAAGDFSSVLLIGNERSIHTLWFYFPILGVRDAEAAFAFYDGLLTYLFPGWSGADGWALQSLQRSWEAGAAAFQDPTISLDAMIARDTHGGVRLAGWGVPPDIMTYRITARAHCEKVSAELLASPRRVPRVEAERNRTQESAQLLLNYLHPQPIDMSETPIYLGPLSGFRSQRSSDVTVRLESGSYLGDKLLVLDPWIESQADASFATTQDFLAEGWGYEPHFLLLIQHPLLWIEHDDGRYRALIDHLSVDVAGSIDGPYSYQPSSLRGGLFATSTPVLAIPEQRLDPPYMNLNEGRIGYGVEGRAAAVNISATPLHVGELSGSDGTFRVPAPLEGTMEGLVITLRDLAANESASIDLTPWLAQQTGTAPAPNRLRSISHPVIDFLLGSRRYRLVVETATFEEVSGTAQSIDLFAGRLFAQP
jgi:hypothetical protein